MLDFVVTGCGRSGTKYTAQLLSQSGVRCSHEEVFGPKAMKENKPAHNRQKGCGESSWIAAGILRDLRPRYHKLRIIHQVRNPVHVIRSMVGIRSFGRRTNYRNYIYAKLPEIGKRETPVMACMKFWVLWNEMIDGLCGDYMKITERVEIISSEPSVLPRLASFVGHEVNQKRSDLARAKLGTTVHTCTKSGAITWDTLPGGEWKERLKRNAMLVGYSEEELYKA